MWINITTSALIKEITCAQNINSRKGAELINFYLASNNVVFYLLSYPRNSVPYSQGTKINTEVDFPNQISLGPKALNYTVLFQLYVKTIFILTFRQYLSLFVCIVSLPFLSPY